MLTKKISGFFACVLTAALILSFSACGTEKTKIDTDTLYAANTVDAALKSHSSIMQTTSYYENLDNTETFESVAFYSTGDNSEYYAAGYEPSARNDSAAGQSGTESASGSSGSNTTGSSAATGGTSSDSTAAASSGTSASGTAASQNSSGQTATATVGTSSDSAAAANSGTSTASSSGNSSSSTSDRGKFTCCIYNNIEYYKTSENKVLIYPLTSDYMKDFTSRSFIFDKSSDTTVSSVDYTSDTVTITATADISTLFTKDTLATIESLSGTSLSTVKYVFTADKDSLLISSLKTYYVSNSGKDFLFSDSEVRYDISESEQPGAGFASVYITPSLPRTVTVVEKDGVSTTIDKYTLPSDISPDFRAFTDDGFSMYTDETCTVPYKSETADSQGYFSDVTCYALRSSASDSGSSDSDGSGSGSSASSAYGSGSSASASATS